MSAACFHLEKHCSGGTFRFEVLGWSLFRGGQNVSESSESFSVVPSLEGPEGFLGLHGPRAPAPRPFPPWWGSRFSREPGEGAPELQGEQKGIMVARMRARQSATSLLGAQAKAGVRPEAERQKREEEEKGDETKTWRKQERQSRRQRQSSFLLVFSQFGTERSETLRSTNSSPSLPAPTNLLFITEIKFDSLWAGTSPPAHTRLDLNIVFKKKK